MLYNFKNKIGMKNIFFTLFLITSLIGFSQQKSNDIFVGQIVSDSNTVKEALNLNASFDPITNSSNKIEIRLISYTTPEFISYYLLTFNQNWSVKYFVFNAKKGEFLAKPLNAVNTEVLFNRLALNNIFSLPDQKNIKAEKQLFNKETSEITFQSFGISHGVNYIVEFKVGEKFRRYNYTNPIENAKFFPHVNEYKNMSSIVKAFAQLSAKRK
jgi:hypothetical protein